MYALHRMHEVYKDLIKRFVNMLDSLSETRNNMYYIIYESTLSDVSDLIMLATVPPPIPSWSPQRFQRCECDRGLQ